MIFKNLTIYSFNKPAPSMAEIEEKLTEKPFSPCAKMQLVSSGWAFPLGKHGSMYGQSIEGKTMLCLKTEAKVLPPACVSDALKKRVDEIEQKEDRRIIGKEKSDLKEEVIMGMLPNAFVKSSLMYGYIDHISGLLIINTGSRPRAEDFVSTLRDALGTLPVLPLMANNHPVSVLTQWVKQGYADMPFSLGKSCKMASLDEEGQTVSANNHDLEQESIVCHISEGKVVNRLSLVHDGETSFDLCDDLVMKKVKFGPAFSDKMDDFNADSVAAEFDAQFSLMSLELSRLIPDVVYALGGEPDPQ